jgi:hypothetical protein
LATQPPPIRQKHDQCNRHQSAHKQRRDF